MSRSKSVARGVRAALVAGLLGTAGLVTAEPAQASTPVAITCGAVLHQDAYLPADLTCPEDNGITVDADISIDLRGHYLKGSGSGGTVGVSVVYPANLKITHGRLTGWLVGLAVVAPYPLPPGRAQHTTIIAVTFLSNGSGVITSAIHIPGAPIAQMTIWRSWFVDNTFGLGGGGGDSAVTVAGGAFERNDVGVYEAAFGTSNRLDLSKTSFTENNVGLMCKSAVCNASNNTFTDNPVAVQTDGQDALPTLTGNTVTGSTQGAANINDTRNAVVTGNTISSSSVGINFAGSSGSISNNMLTGNGQGVQLLVPSDRSLYPLARVTGNRVSGSVQEGIRLDGGSGAAIGGNAVVDNGSYGIYTPGAVDLGGNHASGNKSTPQCVGVICTPGR